MIRLFHVKNPKSGQKVPCEWQECVLGWGMTLQRRVQVWVPSAPPLRLPTPPHWVSTSGRLGRSPGKHLLPRLPPLPQHMPAASRGSFPLTHLAEGVGWVLRLLLPAFPRVLGIRLAQKCEEQRCLGPCPAWTLGNSSESRAGGRIHRAPPLPGEPGVWAQQEDKDGGRWHI